MKKGILFIIVLMCTLQLAVADITLPGIISDNMVLQQQSKVTLWGIGNKNSQITIIVSWSGQTYKTRTDNNGNWALRIQTPGAGGPYEMSISDGIELHIHNIMIGEVWLCSGQSNMEMPLKGYPGQPVFGAQEAISKARKNVPLRFISIEKNSSSSPTTTINSVWKENTAESIKNVSALAYYYAKNLQTELNVPVGIISCSWGGSSIEAWMDSTTLSKCITFTSSQNEKPLFQRNSQLFNGMIYPIKNYTIKGILWYQGESNVAQYEFYQNALPAMVQSWRKLWNIGDFPFYFAQIAPWNYAKFENTVAARFREVQVRLANMIPNSGLVSTIDLGDSVQIHPPHKQEIADRFFYYSLACTYNKTGVDFRSPELNSFSISNDTVTIDFKYAPDGLYSTQQIIPGFELAENNRQFKTANAFFIKKGLKMIVISSEIKKPVAIRYAFKNYSKAVLFNILGFPLLPFRTDNWN